MIDSLELLSPGGKAEVVPEVVVSESWNTFRIRITLGKDGLTTTDSVGLVCGSNIDRWHFQFASSIWGQYVPWQVRDPAAANYLTAEVSGRSVELRLSVGEGGPLKAFHNQPDHIIQALKARYRYVLEVSPLETDLPEGTVIELTWGDRRWGSPGVRAPATGIIYYFLPFIYSRLPRYDRDLPYRCGAFETMPCVRVTGKTATKLHVVGPPFLGVGQMFDLQVVAVDAHGNRDENYSGEVAVRSAGILDNVPAKVVFSAADRGVIKLEKLSFRQAGNWTVSIIGGGIQGRSHYFLVSETAPEQQLYWGALHGHTLDGDGILTAHDHFEYARETARLDFASLSVHSEYFNCKPAWDRYLEAAGRINESNQFVTFYGYEWAGDGHVNAYFKDLSEVHNFYGKNILNGEHPEDTPSFRTPVTEEPEFLAQLKALPGDKLAVSHFHARHMDPVDDEILRLHEVYSMHQQNTLEAKYRQILERGLKIGAVCGSDTHRWPIGFMCPDPDAIWQQPEVIDGHKGSLSMQKKCGIQATFASELSRDGIWRGMKRRHCYGTTGARIIVMLRLGQALMGEQARLRAGEKPTLKVTVGGTAPLSEVTIVRFTAGEWSEPLRQTGLAEDFVEFEWTDKMISHDTLYFLRVRQKDGERAWTSPIWVECQGQCGA